MADHKVSILCRLIDVIDPVKSNCADWQMVLDCLDNQEQTVLVLEQCSIPVQLPAMGKWELDEEVLPHIRPIPPFDHTGEVGLFNWSQPHSFADEHGLILPWNYTVNIYFFSVVCRSRLDRFSSGSP